MSGLEKHLSGKGAKIRKELSSFLEKESFPVFPAQILSEQLLAPQEDRVSSHTHLGYFYEALHACQFGGIRLEDLLHCKERPFDIFDPVNKRCVEVKARVTGQQYDLLDKQMQFYAQSQIAMPDFEFSFAFYMHRFDKSKLYSGPIDDMYSHLAASRTLFGCVLPLELVLSICEPTHKMKPFVRTYSEKENYDGGIGPWSQTMRKIFYDPVRAFSDMGICDESSFDDRYSSVIVYSDPVIRINGHAMQSIPIRSIALRNRNNWIDEFTRSYLPKRPELAEELDEAIAQLLSKLLPDYAPQRSFASDGIPF